MKTSHACRIEPNSHAVGHDLDCAESVNAVMTQYPATIEIFNRFGVDTCCGAVLSVEQAAQANAVDAQTLCAALREVTSVGRRPG